MGCEEEAAAIAYGRHQALKELDEDIYTNFCRKCDYLEQNECGIGKECVVYNIFRMIERIDN